MSVTIAIPFYNAEKYLIDAIKSVFAQTYQDWELILIDDGSTDGSLSIAQSVKDNRIRVLSDGKNKKLAARLNEVTQLAKYDYIARMDADDLMLPDRIETQLNYLLNNPEIDLITTGVYSVLNNLALVGIRGADFEYPKFDDLLTRKVGVIHAALMARKSWYQRNKYDEGLKIAQDLDLWLRASKNNDFHIKSIAQPLYIYREEDNVTKSKLLRAYKNERGMIRKYGNGSVIQILIKSYFKSFAVQIIIFLGLLSRLQLRRGNTIITDKILNKYNSSIKIIENTKLH